MDKNIRISLLLGFYDGFLTDRQRALMEMHYAEDLSLAEIAEKAGITRQGVHDALRRGEETLELCEGRLRLMEKYLAVQTKLDALDAVLAGKTLDAAQMEKMRLIIQEAKAVWEGDDGV